MNSKLPFLRGDYVRLFGLNNQSFNGKIGTVENFDEEKRRFVVKQHSGKSILIKPENLEEYFNESQSLKSFRVRFQNAILGNYRDAMDVKSDLFSLKSEDFSEREDRRLIEFMKIRWCKSMMNKRHM